MSKQKQALKKAKIKFSDEYVYQILTADGKKIEDYFILLSTSKVSEGLIHYWWNGKIWMSMDNDDFNLACINFLKRNGVTTFTDPDNLKKFEEELKAKLLPS